MPDTHDWNYILGTGHWEAVREKNLSIDDLLGIARGWGRQIGDIQRPWLCWNVDPAWCLVQQKLVVEAGWTPVVGGDPRAARPALLKESIFIDFNKELQLPTMWLHFPMEFIFAMAPRMAFWHADLLLRREKMEKLARSFADMPDGEAAAVRPRQGRLAFLSPRQLRYWEVIGCNTRAASKSQFDQGAGWWMNFWDHPSTPPAAREARSRYYYDSGSGVRCWHKKLGGHMHLIDEAYIEEGHCTRIGRKDYKEASPNNFTRNLTKELSLNNELTEVCGRLGIADLLDA